MGCAHFFITSLHPLRNFFLPPLMLLIIDDNLWTLPWNKYKIKSQLVSSHISLSGFFFFFLSSPLETVSKLGRKRKQGSRRLPEDVGKQHYLTKQSHAWCQHLLDKGWETGGRTQTRACPERICSHQSILLRDQWQRSCTNVHNLYHTRYGDYLGRVTLQPVTKHPQWAVFPLPSSRVWRWK